MSQSPAIGTLIGGKYRIEGLLGAGGMGTVFRARNELIDKVVALKWLHPRAAAARSAKDRFLREARAAASIKHPNIVDIYDAGKDESSLYLVMELLEGATLDAWLGRSDVPFTKVLRWLVEGMRGVDAAHRAGVIHRDVKPENLFVLSDELHPEGITKVLDFGISKVLDNGMPLERLTTTGTAIGTPAYMSWEQLSGADVDARTDVYSFGVILYEALTGRMPFEGQSLAALAVAITTAEPPSPRQLQPQLPVGLAQIATKAIARERSDRYATMQELIDVLTPWLSEASLDGFKPNLGDSAPLAGAQHEGMYPLEVSSPISATSMRVAGLKRRHVASLGFVAVMAMATAMGLLGWWLWHDSGQPATEPKAAPHLVMPSKQQSAAIGAVVASENQPPAPQIPSELAISAALPMEIRVTPVKREPPRPAPLVEPPATKTSHAPTAPKHDPSKVTAPREPQQPARVPPPQPPAAAPSSTSGVDAPRAAPRAASGLRSGTLRRDEL